jgi:hypothetical protein
MLLALLLSHMPTPAEFQLTAIERIAVLAIFWAAGLMVLKRSATLLGDGLRQRGGWLLACAAMLLWAGWYLCNRVG